MTLPPAIRIVEVGPRDGLQNIPEPIPTATKIELIRRLYATGLRTIELTAAVSPRAIPQLADCAALLDHPPIRRMQHNPHLHLPVLVPNLRGLETARAHGATEVAVFVSATEGFSKANVNCSVAEGLERARRVAEKAHEVGIVVRGYVSCIFADPFDGPTDRAAVLRCTRELLAMGCYEVSLGDTVGVGSAAEVRGLVNHLRTNGVPVSRLAGHFHDTGGQALENVWAAYGCGVRVFDSSVGGLGGCPYAPGAKGNVATEEVVGMFESMGVQTGVDLRKMVEVAGWVMRQVKGEKEVDLRALEASLVRRMVRDGVWVVGEEGMEEEEEEAVEIRRWLEEMDGEADGGYGVKGSQSATETGKYGSIRAAAAAAVAA